MRVLVTGATGFIGRALSKKLIRDGHEVIAATRSEAGDVVDGCRRLVVGEIDGRTSWDAGLEQTDAVVHLAARTHESDRIDSASAYRTLNVDGTRKLADAAVSARVRQFVFMSSIKVNGEQSPMAADGRAHRFSADDAPEPTTEYGRSKWEAEQVLRQTLDATGTRLTVLRPPLVYGPGQKANLHALMRAVDKGLPLPLASIKNRRSLIDVDNLADALVIAMTTRLNSTTYTLADVDVSIAALVEAMAGALGRRSNLVRCPHALLELVATICGRRAQLEKIVGSLLVDSERFIADSGWMPARTLEQSLSAAAEQYLSITRT
ncbi:MAG: NAD-dependent epimerase/dehydratase family protein [Proteobacteria bacterium]|nr:NAD-dependent epimerase/dehydratase family protein [Pseudomonadota bacterium]